jgi:hypothetical protein
MCCDPKEFRGRDDALGCVSVCCPPGFSFRRFVSSKEKRERLEEYKAQLEKELAGVEERIQDFKGK